LIEVEHSSGEMAGEGGVGHDQGKEIAHLKEIQSSVVVSEEQQDNWGEGEC